MRSVAAGWAMIRRFRRQPLLSSHDVPNLFVIDASVFPSASEKNPTHTIMALAARTAHHIANSLEKGELHDEPSRHAKIIYARAHLRFSVCLRRTVRTTRPSRARKHGAAPVFFQPDDFATISRICGPR